MIDKLRKKMMWLIMSIITSVIVGILFFTNVVPFIQSYYNAQDFLNRAIWMEEKQDNRRPNSHNMFKEPNISQNDFNFSNVIEIYLDKKNGIVFYLCDRQDLIQDSFVSDAVQYILHKDRTFGIYDSYYYSFQNDRIYMLDNTMNFRMRKQTLLYSILACLGAWVLLFWVSRFVIQRLLKPIEQSIENQRRFISDAGHELKTPIAVIGTNAAVLKEEIGENKWLSYIEKETGQMEYLVKELMTLSQMEDNANDIVFAQFNLSKCVLKACLPFESLAFESHVNLDMQIEDNILFTGDENKISQLVTIFLSNALKYGKEEGDIIVKLSEEEDSKILLSFYNTGQGIKEEDKEKIFERFYRVDKARSRKEGSHGLGLAIAKAIVNKHNGSIHVSSVENEWIEFDVELPN